MEYKDVSDNIHLERIKKIKEELEDIIHSMECELVENPEYKNSEDETIKMNSDSSNKIYTSVKNRKHKNRISRVNASVSKI